MNVQTPAPLFFISALVIFLFFPPPVGVLVLQRTLFEMENFRFHIFFYFFLLHQERGVMGENASWHTLLLCFFLYFARFWTTHQQLPRSVCAQLGHAKKKKKKNRVASSQSNRILLLSVAITVHTSPPLSSNLHGWMFFCFECFLISGEASYHPITLAAACLLG